MKKMYIIIAFLSAFMLVSSVSAVPTLTVQTVKENEMEKLANNISNAFSGITNSTMYKNIEDKVIEKFGKEFQEDYHFRMKLTFCQNLHCLYVANYEDKTVSIHSGTPIQLAFEPLFELVIMIMYVILLIFGHNIIGESLAVGTAMLLLIVPCLVVAFGMAIPISFELVAFAVLSFTGINLEEFIYDWGLLGLTIFATVIIPIMVIISLILIPLLWGWYTVINIIDCLIIAIEMLE